MLILFVELEIDWSTCLEFVELEMITYASIEVFEDPIGLFGVDCGSSGSVGMLHFFWLNVYLESLLPFFE